MDEAQPCKRKRVGTACDTCRKSKIKCDGKLPQCSRCARIKINCVYTPVARKSVPVKRTKLIEGLEDRLNRIESFVMSDLVSESLDLRGGDGQKAPSRYEPNGRGNASPRAYPSRPGKNKASRLGIDHATPHSESSVLSTSTRERNSMDFVATDMKGQSRYIGSASGFSIFSPRGIAWINEKVGDAQFMSVVSSAKCDKAQCDHFDMWADVTSTRLHRRLPPKEETRALLREFFGELKSVTSLFHEATFMSLFESRFTQEYDPLHGPGWWACLNMALAMTHRVRVLHNLTLQEEEEIALLYFKNAMAVLTELMVRGPNILNIQALLIMAIYSQGSPNVELSYFLGSAAVRLSQNMGLHRESSGGEMGPHETQERRRVFWVGYILDKNASLRYGRPPNQDDDDMDVPLLGGEASDGTSATIPEHGSFTSTFRAMCKLAMIEGKVYKRLYSAKASKQSTEEIVHTVDQLDQELAHWRQSVPEEFRPESEIKVSDDVVRLQIVNFHMDYYHCLSAIHRKLLQHGNWASPPESLTDYEEKEEIHQHVFSSAVLCVSAARASINLIRLIPQSNLACIWIMLCYVVMSYLALCVNIYQNPEDSKATLDLKLMKIVTNFLSLLKSDETDPTAHHLIQICGEFERLARRAVRDAQERRTTKGAQHPTPAPPPATIKHPTPIFTPGMAQVNGFAQETETSISGRGLEGNNTPQESVYYANFGAADSTVHRQGSLLFNSETAATSQSIGNGGEETDFTDGAIPPQYTGVPTSSDFWQLPMPLEWNWTDMNANYYLPME